MAQRWELERALALHREKTGEARGARSVGGMTPCQQAAAVLGSGLLLAGEYERPVKVTVCLTQHGERLQSSRGVPSLSS